MFEKIKGNILFRGFLKRPDINKAYAMVGPEDSWFQTISTVHNSLAEIQKLPHETWKITSHDGLCLRGLFYPGESDKTMIWVHGYTSHAERESAFPGLFYHSMGYNVLIPYQRAHGISEGKFISFGALEQEDMQLWVDRVNQVHPHGQILIHGLSMGGGIVLDLASRDMKNVKCLIADAPNVSIEGVLRGATNFTFKKNADKICPYVIARYQKEFSRDAAAFDRMNTISGGRYPLLLSAGSKEGLEEVFAQLKEKNPQETEIVILPGCDHGNGMYKQTQMYQNAIRDFVERYITKGQ